MEFFRVGKIVNTHGLKGEVKVMPETSDVNNYKRYGTVGIDSIEEAEKFKNKLIQVPREREPELPEDTFYVKDLIGIHVYDTEGKDLGPIYDVIETKNNDVYWIRKPKELLIPVLKEIVLEINLDEEKIIIRPVGEWQDED